MYFPTELDHWQILRDFFILEVTCDNHLTTWHEGKALLGEVISLKCLDDVWRSYMRQIYLKHMYNIES